MDKWLMFKNYMHNELHITKDDVKQWIMDAVEQQAKALVNNEFQKFDVRNIVMNIITDNDFFGGRTMKQQIINEVSKQLVDRINFIGTEPKEN